MAGTGHGARLRVYPMEPGTSRHTCEQKRRYDSPAQADHARRYTQRYVLVIYRCDWCKGYHLGNLHHTERS